MSYVAGMVVYVKIKGYPWWPAKVEEESSIPENVLSKKPKGSNNKPMYCVKFYGTGNYGWIINTGIKPFDKKEAEISLEGMKSKSKMLERSMREALEDFKDESNEEFYEESSNNKKLDMSKADKLFTEIENFPVTIPLLKQSKIGKVMRKIREIKVDGDDYNIIKRSDELVKKWYKIFQATPSKHEREHERDQHEQYEQGRATLPTVTIDINPTPINQQEGDEVTPIDSTIEEGDEVTTPMEVIKQEEGSEDDESINTTPMETTIQQGNDTSIEETPITPTN
ncbi:8575_t:CDS:2 [Diversispora eburnea]|uniref:8575_t:CDS:1 n=1 Tax=Diversispora eburnea TaxID=1213867 RepID=A0A9N8YHZ7_9GLOM|nr:8575_t:CDS:2 [Diversispora eburnea]